MLEGFAAGGGGGGGGGLNEIKTYIVYFIIWLKLCGNILYF